MPTKLSLYNGALRHLGTQRLASLTENSVARRELDEAFDPVLRSCLEDGYWTFAMRTVQIPASDELESMFGYAGVFVRPDDYIRTFKLSLSERFDPPLEDYQVEAGYWYADAGEIYLRYISDALDLGFNTAMFPRSFSDFLEAALAKSVCKVVTGSHPDEGMERAILALKRKARAHDAMDEGTERAPQGTWSRSRAGGWSNRSRWNGKFI